MVRPGTRRRRWTRPLAAAAVVVAGAVVLSCSRADDAAAPTVRASSPTDAPPPTGSSTTVDPSAVDTTIVETTAAVETTDAAQTTAVTSAVPATLAGPPMQPPQPASGLGGTAVAHADWRVNEGGTGADAWYVFEPVAPQPVDAPLAIVMHGYFEFSGYDQMYEFIRHTVLGGTIVIYPRYQTDVAVPCPGPYDIEPCLQSATTAILDAIQYLRSDSSRVQPRTATASYFGFSFGGIITANITNRFRTLGLPEPDVIFLDDPHDGGLVGPGETALDRPLTGIPATTLVQCHVGAQGVIAEAGKQASSCNAVFAELGHIPDANKDLVLTHPDEHGSPGLSSAHGVCAAWPGQADAYDWNFCWKVWDGLRQSAATGTPNPAALGDTPEHRDLGTWSDGTPITPLIIQDDPPIAP